MGREELLLVLKQLYDIANINNNAFLQIFCEVNYYNNNILNKTDAKINTMIDLIFDKLHGQISSTSDISASPSGREEKYQSLSSQFLDAQIEIHQGKKFRKGR